MSSPADERAVRSRGSGASMAASTSPRGRGAPAAAVGSTRSGRPAEARRLDAEILSAIARGWEDPLNEDEVNALARRLFAHQARYNPIARAWWRTAGTRADRVDGWAAVPPLPVAAYKRSRVAAFPGRAPRFLSSGTTSVSRSRVFLESLDLYAAAILPSFRRHCLPDRARMRLLFLAPSAGEAPRSSLSAMFEVLREEFGDECSAFHARAGALELAGLCSALGEAQSAGIPVFLLGPAFAFVHALDGLRARGARFELPSGSRIFQTGGFKGRSRAVQPEELEAGYAELLGIPPKRVLNEYGMAELASQFYAGADRRYSGPPWVRWRVLDPLRLEPVAERPGVLAVWDLANRSHCFALRTEDLAIQRGDRFELLGRLEEAEPRGCSLAADPAFGLAV